ncbi:Gfo/Idh/MocA family oxidoreductase [Arenibacter sp. 6A1]|uniref:Gfo/Idh/MocA family protein n=1 Tax=Arenibacter sp. 6A1 TaxID=2720391 RepID=UPI001444E4C5|nr:Gfo/Idh/MocA family oxidoreductase [Arenibacter sp. 6A1]NKI25140.1 Gfo/Idh/MocA family oxidoreductase [Arenibacter sp. 6A1]
MGQKIRWGIIGLGNIAHHFVKDLAMVNDAEIIAVASRNIVKANEFAAQYGVKQSFGSYESLLQCEEVDVVYIATPHTFHVSIALMAMNYKKNVLCEKPLGVNTDEVERVIACARENKVFLMEALWSRFNPAVQKVKQLVDAKEIGDIAFVHADFAFYAMDRDLKGRVLNPELAGGSLLDIGIYPAFLAYILLGVPEKVLSTSSFYENGVEVQTSMIFKYPRAQAVLYSGFTSKSSMKAEIYGDKGVVCIQPRWHEAQGYSVEKNNEIENFPMPTEGRGYYYEIMEVNDCIRQGKLQSDLWSHQNSLDLIGILDLVRRQSGIVFPFEP